MTMISDPLQIDEALYRYNKNLAIYVKEILDISQYRRIVEIGSGSGTFTFPFLEVIRGRFQEYYCIDPYNGPYIGDEDHLKEKFALSNLKKKTVIQIKDDAVNISNIFSEMDLIIGHEVFGDLNQEKVTQIMESCFISLKLDGIFVHSGLSPFASNSSETMTLIANDHSENPLTDTDWFSPSADDLAGIAYKVGFRTIKVEYRKIPLKFVGEAAIEMLRRWNTRSNFIEERQDEFSRIGIEYPMEQILFCKK